MFAWFCIFVCASAGCVVAVHEYTMPGQPHEVPVNSTGVVRAALFAMVEYNRDNAEDLFAYKIVNITSAKIQVVAGINYILEVKLGRTMCKTSDTTDTEPCVYHSEPKELRCHFVVTEIPWEDSSVLTQNKCNNHGSDC
ncbi:cystatin-like [Morone saxatilis]|uniref:cystatin-like n=1 Tax=Morone saxatilis TaxID=34816 RepID=UPI0015E1DC1B|nr:cystatin-like [Morone saxatilis]